MLGKKARTGSFLEPVWAFLFAENKSDLIVRPRITQEMQHSERILRHIELTQCQACPDASQAGIVTLFWRLMPCWVLRFSLLGLC